jgi:hypothetical protein
MRKVGPGGRGFASPPPKGGGLKICESDFETRDREFQNPSAEIHLIED